MNKIFLSILITPIVYLAIAALLALLPVKRQEPAKSLDFDVLDLETISASSASDGQYNARDNTALYYRKLEGDANITLVLIHGSGSEGRYLVPLAEQLNKQFALSVIVPDLRGHGRSQAGHPGDVSYLGQFNHDLNDLLSHILHSKPNDKIVLAGHSSGGGLVVRYLGANPNAADAALLLAPYLGYNAPTTRKQSGGWVQVSMRRYAGLSMLNMVGIRWLNQKPVLFFNRPDALNDEWQVPSYTYRLNESLAPKDYTKDLANFKNPLAIMVGENDEALYPKAFQEVFGDMTSKHSFVLFKETKHLDLPLDEHLPGFISQWLEKAFVQ